MFIVFTMKRLVLNGLLIDINHKILLFRKAGIHHNQIMLDEKLCFLLLIKDMSL